eukprot:TRINITY_DN7687_c0_g1_i1.p1 TRINITY_DN7687_c0_g1~~TRINITY_DN7687_c0_g1_i1.p1  ORF type:complete len:770 (+),score=209.30 TRINITY_DN7687_c0_g1_i1:54-2312(+)
MDVDFELSQQLQGHESQVRCVAILDDGTLVSGGLDSQVIMWRRPSPTEGFVLLKKLGLHTDFIYALAPSHTESGSFYSGSKDKTAMKCDSEGNPCLQFEGHEGPVCSIVEIGAKVVTGSWDGKAKVWDCSNGQCLHTLEAGAHAVSVAALPTGEVVTGSQDKSLRVFRGAECVKKVDEAHGDIIRAIASSSTSLLTASNDCSLKMWSLDGLEMATLTGHQSFVYGVTFSSDAKEILSASDDCTLKLWSVSDTQCKQSLVHAGTVWQGCSLPNGDVVSACGDMMVRVWSRDPERMAPEAERNTQKEIAEQAAVAAAQKGSSSVPMDTATDISQMPSTIGKKNGEIKCFKDGGTVFAFSWNAGARQWDKIGEVVGSQEEKKSYEGDAVFPAGEYDFIFDVDMGAGLGMRKLPFTKGQNPLVVAEAFCNREQINRANAEQIRQFIIQNAGEGVASGTEGIGYGTDGAATNTSASSSAAPAASILEGLMQCASFKDGKFEALQGKILEFNGQVDEALRLDAVEASHLTEGIKKLKTGVTTELRHVEKEMIIQKLAQWPQDKLFPVVDLWRLFLAHPTSSDLFKGTDRGTSYILQMLGYLAADVNGPLGLCSARYLANLFIYQTNKYAAFDKKELIMKGVGPALSSTNKHTKVACASVLLNLAVVLHESSQPPKVWDVGSAEQVAQLALDFLGKAAAEDEDAKHRAVLAISFLLVRDSAGKKSVAAMCKAADLPSKLASLESKLGPNVSAELKKLLS